MTSQTQDVTLSIIVTIVGGADPLRRCLAALQPQIDPSRMEIIVPYDQWSLPCGDLAREFPAVTFSWIDDLGAAALDSVPAHTHRLYDRRRAAGLAWARGHIVAMTEDHAVPAPNWCRQILTAHEQPYAVIGGAIENEVDEALNWALYYCDFGRYGRPLTAGAAGYVSDVNVAYKRRALETTRSVWTDMYHETTVHWALRAQGETIVLDPTMVVSQHRPPIGLRRAYRERIEWGRVFAETRVSTLGRVRGFLYAAITPVLPALLLIRVVRHMRRQGRGLQHMATTAPLAFLLTTGWAFGELLGYVMGPPSATPPSGT